MMTYLPNSIIIRSCLIKKKTWIWWGTPHWPPFRWNGYSWKPEWWKSIILSVSKGHGYWRLSICALLSGMKMKVHTGNISPLSAGSIIVWRDLQRLFGWLLPSLPILSVIPGLLPPSIVVFLLRWSVSRWGISLLRLLRFIWKVLVCRNVRKWIEWIYLTWRTVG